MCHNVFKKKGYKYIRLTNEIIGAVLSKDKLGTHRLTGREKRVGGFDLLWDDGPIYDDDAFDCAGSSSAPFNSFLGKTSSSTMFSLDS